ncbi:ATP-dependent DNA helicase DDX11-like [Amphibalanus amphitrite]|uniref:ATP-dependent DNA helicase DDX11-like n=1 Tax=Amphibalanus amphitrite TaxID=1232801 RepID=UPI001C90729B|nr:ATP-dependent DNA helicase DDX11-like [Amphibalanus amphitrite]XP_043238265.1 ATP-dependent DNA helicase DDX11-like [Amphibalanus amphitrite]
MEVPETFEFPFPPYKAQEDFMKNLYKALEEKKLGIFESPTGTGKSLALICGAVRWLRDHEARELADAEAAVAQLRSSGGGAAAAGASPDDWLAEQAVDRERRQQLLRAERQLEALQRARARATVKRGPRRPEKSAELARQEDEFRQLFGDVVENDPPDSSGQEEDLIAEFHSDEDSSSDEDPEEEEEYHGTQIIYTSRTHSQLSQFVGEVRRSPHADHVRLVALASRPQLCINDSVRRLGSVGLVNQACLDMQNKTGSKATKVTDGGRAEKKQKSTGACPYKRRVDDMAAEVLSEVRDIEQLVAEGRRRKACPYYASRRAVKHAQLVVVPYNNLLHAGTRQASGVRLTDSVVIVDEAHNLLETIGSIHTCHLSYRQVSEALEQLNHYIETYKKRFSPKNLLYLRQLLHVHKGIIKLVDSTTKTMPPGSEQTKVLLLNDFLCGATIDNLNMRKLLLFADKSRLVQKLRGCWKKRQVTAAPVTTGRSAVSQFLREIQQPVSDQAQATAEQQPEAPAETRTSDMPLMATLQLISALSDPDRDCRLLISTTRAEPPTIKYLPLNAAAQFTDIVKEARAVVLAGGTMQPVSEFRDQLLVAAGAAPSRVTVFSCGHVVPSDQLLTLSLAAGPSGAELLFNYQNRALPATMSELGRVLVSLCTLVPAGVICFLPSYDYAAATIAHLTSTGAMDRIAAKKQVFREPRQANRADAVLSQYSAAARGTGRRSTGPSGAILFCVVGGKMSEGINFSDDLGRCVVVVGLPYPNARSPELVEKMNFLDANVKRSEDGRTAGQILYENLCMKAVNQSIGRAIRHKNDYACVVLCDARYSRASTVAGLPEWIRRQMGHHAKFGPAFGQIRQFFKKMQEKFPSS